MKVPKCIWIVSENCQRTILHADTPAEQAVLNREAERRLLAAFITGPRGAPGKHVRIQMPGTVDKALNMAISTTQAELSDRDNLHENRVDRQTVFTVWGSCQNTRNGHVNPRQKIQWSRYRD
jgi:hypothetical protein